MDNFIKPEHVQGSQEWLEHRKNHLGASEASIVMGLSPWTTPYQLWERKLGLAAEQEETWQMRRGTELEPIALRQFCDEVDIEMFPQIVYHPEHRFMMASMDGLSLDRKEAVEIKCPGQSAHATALDGYVPEYYMPQLQHQLACLGLDVIWYYSFDGNSGVALRVERDNEFIKRMIDAELAFWECVQKKEPPEMTYKDYEDRSSAKRVAYHDRLVEIERQIKSLESEKKIIKDDLIKDANGRSTSGSGLLLTKSYPKGRVDYSAIPELQDMDLEQYRKPSKPVWTLRIAK